MVIQSSSSKRLAIIHLETNLNITIGKVITANTATTNLISVSRDGWG